MRMSLANANESFAVNSLVVNGFSSSFIYWDNLYVGVLIAERIGRSLGMLSTNGLWTLAKPYKTLRVGCLLG